MLPRLLLYWHQTKKTSFPGTGPLNLQEIENITLKATKELTYGSHIHPEEKKLQLHFAETSVRFNIFPYKIKTVIFVFPRC
jgi:hypothetical protein